MLFVNYDDLFVLWLMATKRHFCRAVVNDTKLVIVGPHWCVNVSVLIITQSQTLNV